MATVSAGAVASVYCPLASTVTVTPGFQAVVRVENPRGSDSFAQKRISAATSFSAAAGETMFIEAVGQDATYAISSNDTTSLVLNDQAAASENTAAIQAALDGGGSCNLVGLGNVYINDTIWLDDGDRLTTATGTTIVLADSADKLMIGTAPMEESAVTVTVTWTNGPSFSIAWTAHGRSVGDAICLQGATETVWNQVYRVASVIDSNTITVLHPDYVAASPTGTITAKRCITGIKLDVSLDYNYANNTSAPSGFDRHACYLAFAYDIPQGDIKVRAKDVYKYGLCLCATLNVNAWVNGRNTSDICKLYGPARDTFASASGYGRDDCATIQAKEPAAFIAYMAAFGPITQSGFRDLSVINNGGTASGAVVVYADPDHVLDDIVIDGGSALSNLNEGLSIKHGDTFSSSKIRRVTVKNLAMGCKTGDYVVVVSCAVDVLEFDRPRVIPGNSDAGHAIQVFRFESTSVIKTLRFVGWEFNESDWPSATAASYLVNLNGSVECVEFIGCSIRGRAAQARVVNFGTSGARSVAFRGCHFENLSQLAIVNDGASITPTISIENCRFKTVTTGIDVRDDATVVLTASNFDTMSNGVVRPTTNARTVYVYDGGGNSFSSASAITCASPGTAVPYGALPLDIGATGITKASGASCFNTGSGRGTIPQNRPVVCDGTSWFNATNLSHTY